MGRRMQRLAKEAVKFLAVGGIATLVALVLFNLLVHGVPGWTPGVMNQRPLTAFVLANLAGMVVSYRGSRSWAFRHREVVGPTGGLLAYVTINVVTMAIPLVCLAVSRYVLDLDGAIADNVAANVLGLGLGTAARFFLFRRYVFLSPGQARRREMAS